MKKAMWMAGICGLAAGLAYGGGGGPLTGSDNFDDGVRNKTAWKVASWNTGRLAETNRRLYYDTLGGSDFRSAIWYWKTRYMLFAGDKLETSILIDFPRLYMGPDEYIKLGLGFATGFLPSSQSFGVSILGRYNTRYIVAYAGQGGSVDWSIVIPLPRDITRFYLVIRYNMVTGKVTIWQRAANNAWTDKVGTADLNGVWGIPLGTALVLAPFVKCDSGEGMLLQADGLRLDNFNVKLIIP